jgi:muconolactone D-isomerase
MLFFVEMELRVPPDYDPELRKDLVTRERKRAAEITAEGFWKHQWIVPGQRARINICSTADAAKLHETYSSLPAFKFTDLKASPLIECAVGEPIAMSK